MLSCLNWTAIKSYPTGCDQLHKSIDAQSINFNKTIVHILEWVEVEYVLMMVNSSIVFRSSTSERDKSPMSLFFGLAILFFSCFYQSLIWVNVKYLRRIHCIRIQEVKFNINLLGLFLYAYHLLPVEVVLQSFVLFNPIQTL